MMEKRPAGPIVALPGKQIGKKLALCLLDAENKGIKETVATTGNKYKEKYALGGACDSVWKIYKK